MNIFPFTPAGIFVYDSSIDTSTSPTALTSSHGKAGYQSQNIRVTNEGTVAILIAFSSTTANAATDTKALVVLPGTERIFTLPTDCASIDMVTRASSSSGSWQIGVGV